MIIDDFKMRARRRCLRFINIIIVSESLFFPHRYLKITNFSNELHLSHIPLWIFFVLISGKMCEQCNWLTKKRIQSPLHDEPECIVSCCRTNRSANYNFFFFFWNNVLWTRSINSVIFFSNHSLFWIDFFLCSPQTTTAILIFGCQVPTTRKVDESCRNHTSL